MKYLLLSILLSTSLWINAIGQNHPNSTTNFHKFSNSLVADGSYWKASLKDDQNFKSFLMVFSKNEFNGLEGTISGITNKSDTINFWKVYEFTDPFTQEIHFIQTSRIGTVISFSQYADAVTRESQFEITYANGAKEKHRDKHVLIDNETLVTDSAVFEEKTEQWVDQPRMTWKRFKA